MQKIEMLKWIYSLLHEQVSSWFQFLKGKNLIYFVKQAGLHSFYTLVLAKPPKIFVTNVLHVLGI